MSRDEQSKTAEESVLVQGSGRANVKGAGQGGALIVAYQTYQQCSSAADISALEVMSLVFPLHESNQIIKYKRLQEIKC